MRVERCSHEYGTLCSHDGSIAPMPMGGGAPMHGRSAPMHGSIAPMHGRGCSHGWEGVLPSMGALCSHAWERCSHGHGSDAPIMGAQRSIRMGAASLTHGSRAPMSWERRSHVMGAGPKRGRSAPMGSRYGSTSGPAPMHGRGGSHDMGAGRNFWVSGVPGLPSASRDTIIIVDSRYRYSTTELLARPLAADASYNRGVNCLSTSIDASRRRLAHGSTPAAASDVAPTTWRLAEGPRTTHGPR